MEQGLNPYCSGRWSRTRRSARTTSSTICLNPCCSGQWSRTGVITGHWSTMAGS